MVSCCGCENKIFIEVNRRYLDGCRFIQGCDFGREMFDLLAPSRFFAENHSTRCLLYQFQHQNWRKNCFQTFAFTPSYIIKIQLTLRYFIEKLIRNQNFVFKRKENSEVWLPFKMKELFLVVLVSLVLKESKFTIFSLK